jgi:uncharacterized membrane protein
MARPSDPHVPPTEPVPGAQTTGIVHRNIHALLDRRRQEERELKPSVRLADAITRFTGSMGSVYVHMGLFGGWVVVNVGLVPGIRPFDPFPFVMLAALASVEAIFLTTFVLISQNRQAEMADKRAELDLQVGLLSEHEVTRLMQLVDAIAQRLGVQRPDPQHLEELERDVQPERVLEAIEEAEHEHEAEKKKPD